MLQDHQVTMDSESPTVGGRPTQENLDGFHAHLIQGSRPKLQTETQELLRTRLKAASAFLLVVVLLGFLRSTFFEEEHVFRGLHLLFIVVSAVLTSGLFLVPQLKSGMLRILELVLFGSLAAWVGWLTYGTTSSILARAPLELVTAYLQRSLVAFVFIMFFYGLFIPNTWKRAAAVIIPIGLLPFVVRVFLGIQNPELKELYNPGNASFSVFAIAVSACAAIFGTYVINGLRVEAFKARELGQYRLIEKIGSGGMGEVWRASHRMLARPAAIKLIRPDMLDSQDRAFANLVLQRFEREAQATASLRSPHSIVLYDFGITDEGTFYYVMELLDGLDLYKLVRVHGPVSASRTIAILTQVCEALAEAHDCGLVHRDIKPANIFVCRMGREVDFVKVLDFGLVKDQKPDSYGSSQLTQVGTITGTPAFMSPEQGLAKPLDGRSDIYSVGCVGYWLLTGQLVFDDPNPTAMLADHIKTAPTAPSTRIDGEIPWDLENVILRCLEKDPNDRPESAEALIQELSACRDSDGWRKEEASVWWNLHLGSPG